MIRYSMSLIGQSVTSPPVETYAPLGVAGLICVVLGAWLRDVQKERDRAMRGLEEITPTLTRVLDVLELSNTAHATSAQAQQTAASMMVRIPSEETFTRLKVALENAERASAQDRNGAR